jgi:hypothetical protein
MPLSSLGLTSNAGSGLPVGGKKPPIADPISHSGPSVQPAELSEKSSLKTFPHGGTVVELVLVVEVVDVDVVVDEVEDVLVVVLVLVVVVVGGQIAVHAGSPAPPRQVSFAPVSPAISDHAQVENAEQ